MGREFTMFSIFYTLTGLESWNRPMRKTFHFNLKCNVMNNNKMTLHDFGNII